MSSLTLITPPANEPVTLEEAKAWLKIDTADEDALLLRLIATARQMVEHYTSRAVLEQTWRLVVQTPLALPVIVVSKAPAQKLVAAYVQSASGQQTALDLSNIRLDSLSQPARLILSNACLGQGVGSYAFDIVFGYGATPDSVPEAIKHAVLVMVAQAYEQRSGVDGVSVYPALSLLAPLMLRRV